MDEKQFIQKIISTIEEIRKEKGDFRLVMLDAEEPKIVGSSISLVLSAPWLDALTPGEALDYLIPKFKDKMTAEEYKRIYRYVLIHTSDPLIKSINEAYPAELQSAPIEIKDKIINGVQIEEAKVMVSGSLG